MMADLRLVHCYNMTAMSREERDKAILESAKNNLEQLSFFGLTELQNITQYMFEETFNLNFRVKFEQHSTSTGAFPALQNITKDVLDKVRAINRLDIELYEFAKKLFLTRFEAAKASDKSFEDHFNKVNVHAVAKPFNFHDVNDEDYEDEN